jgi:2-aminoadipate transaminase
MLAALDLALGGIATWSRPDGGYFVWLDLPRDVDVADVAARAEAGGVTFVAGTDFFPHGRGGRSSARLAYSFVSPAEIGEGVERLACAVRAARAEPAAAAAAP